MAGACGGAALLRPLALAIFLYKIDHRTRCFECFRWVLCSLPISGLAAGKRLGPPPLGAPSFIAPRGFNVGDQASSKLGLRLRLLQDWRVIKVRQCLCKGESTTDRGVNCVTSRHQASHRYDLRGAFVPVGALFGLLLGLQLVHGCRRTGDDSKTQPLLQVSPGLPELLAGCPPNFKLVVHEDLQTCEIVSTGAAASGPLDVEVDYTIDPGEFSCCGKCTCLMLGTPKNQCDGGECETVPQVNKYCDDKTGQFKGYPCADLGTVTAANLSEARTQCENLWTGLSSSEREGDCVDACVEQAVTFTALYKGSVRCCAPIQGEY
jgi:hypothetical protein